MRECKILDGRKSSCSNPPSNTSFNPFQKVLFLNPYGKFFPQQMGKFLEKSYHVDGVRIKPFICLCQEVFGSLSWHIMKDFNFLV